MQLTILYTLVNACYVLVFILIKSISSDWLFWISKYLLRLINVKSIMCLMSNFVFYVVSQDVHLQSWQISIWEHLLISTVVLSLVLEALPVLELASVHLCFTKCTNQETYRHKPLEISESINTASSLSMLISSGCTSGLGVCEVN